MPAIFGFPRVLWRVLAVGMGLSAYISVMPNALAQVSPGTWAQTLLERQEGVQGILLRQPLELVMQMRQQCAAGKDPGAVARSRALGAVGQADSSDHCPMALVRVAREGQLLVLYRDMVFSLTGESGDYEGLPQAIGAAAMRPGTTRVAIGKERAAVITSALALDAGFTVAYEKGERLAPGMPDLATLKPIAERCLGQQEPNFGLCYSTGYVYGARTISKQPVVSP